MWRHEGGDGRCRARVAVADDHPLLRQGLRLVIEAEPDLEVSGEAASAEEAIRLVGTLRPDVLILDLTMPGGGGLAALGSIRAASAATAVLILTMHEDPECLRVALASGATGFLLKSAAGAELVAAIRSVHQGRTYVDPLLAGVALRSVLGAAERNVRKGPAALLSPREAEVLGLLALGYTNKEVAARLSVGVKSVETYRARLSEKLGLSGRAELVRYAMENGLVVPQKRTARKRRRTTTPIVSSRRTSMDAKRPVNSFNGVRTFSATMARDREQLGDKVTDWIRNNPEKEIVDAVVTQSSDEEFHCLAITLFFHHVARAA